MEKEKEKLKEILDELLLTFAGTFVEFPFTEKQWQDWVNLLAELRIKLDAHP